MAPWESWKLKTSVPHGLPLLTSSPFPAFPRIGSCHEPWSWLLKVPKCQQQKLETEHWNTESWTLGTLNRTSAKCKPRVEMFGISKWPKPKRRILFRTLEFFFKYFFNFIFWSNFWLTVKFRRSCPLSLHMNSLPIISIIHHNGTFVIKNKSALTHHNHNHNPSITLGFTLAAVHSVDFDKCIMTIYLSLSYHIKYFLWPKNPRCVSLLLLLHLCQLIFLWSL